MKKPIKHRPLNHRQIMFCEEYIKTNNATRSYQKAYNRDNIKTCEANGLKLLRNTMVKKYIDKRLKPIEKKAVADADEILEIFTRIVRGEEKDQLGLEASLKDRINAGKELAKRYGLFKDPVDEEKEEKAMPEMKVTIVDNSDLEKVMFEVE